MLHAAKDNPTTPHDVRDILEKAIVSISFAIPRTRKLDIFLFRILVGVAFHL